MPTGHFVLPYKQRAQGTGEHLVGLREYNCLLRKKHCAWSFNWHFLIWTCSVNAERTSVSEDANPALLADLKLTYVIYTKLMYKWHNFCWESAVCANTFNITFFFFCLFNLVSDVNGGKKWCTAYSLHQSLRKENVNAWVWHKLPFC